MKRPDLIAFYLPQYHPIPENDEWWGPGFTEWTHVAMARPLFRGHYQPHIPGELGFYDLRVPETRAAQAELAKEHGISAFCYWHYWFAGRRILERPFNEVLNSGQPRFPFCLAWANETWSGIWHGHPDRILIEQTYPGTDDHVRHFYTLLEAFADDRYFKVDGKPLFQVYKPRSLPEPKRVTDLWRELAHRAGLNGLHLVGQIDPSSLWIPKDHGFDACIITSLPPLFEESSWRRPWRRLRYICRRLRQHPTVYSYRQVLPSFLPDRPRGILNYPCVMPNWDNTPRCGENGLVLRDSRPEYFRLLFRRAIEKATMTEIRDNLIFVKSWNEWAEGNYLEPDRQFGRACLRVVKQELERFPPAAKQSPEALVAADMLLGK